VVDHLLAAEDGAAGTGRPGRGCCCCVTVGHSEGGCVGYTYGLGCRCK
jgi:hypothetical protein